MPFDATAYLQALEKPSYAYTNSENEPKTITGRIVSFNEMVPFSARLGALDKVSTDEEGIKQLETFVRDLLKFLEMEEATPHVLALPIDGLMECVTELFMDAAGKRRKK